MRAPPLDPHARDAPTARFLANGTYRVLVTAAGTGGSWYRDHACTSWTGDRVEDPDAFSIYVRNLVSGAFWSVGHQPVQRPAERYQASWVPGRFRIEREDDGVVARLDIAVAATAALEMRRLTLVNRSPRRIRLELTSYAEVVLAPAVDHAAHPAFSKLFVQTESFPALAALLARRRPRSPSEQHPWLVHALSGVDVSGHETDRVRFLGRGGSRAAPLALRNSLAGTCGDVLDPIVSLRCVFDLAAGESRVATFLLGAGDDRDSALSMVADHARAAAIDTAFVNAETAARAALAPSCLDLATCEYAHALAGAILYRHPSLCAQREVRPSANGTREDLERLGLSPQRPFVLVRSSAASNKILSMHAIWQDLGLPIDLVLLGGGPTTNAEIQPPWVGALRVLDPAVIASADIDLLETRARLVVHETLPDLDCEAPRPTTTAFTPIRDNVAARTSPPPAHVSLEYANGYGGFAEDGREYVLFLRGEGGSLHGLPPQPWTNVIANEHFGFLVSETGAGCTWSQNSREHRLSPWANDPVLDPHDEAFYVRDEMTGEFWSPLPGPAPADGDYEVHHSFGWSAFRHQSHELEQETTLFVSRHDPVKFAVVRLTNTSDRERRLSLFAYQHLTLGALPEENATDIVSEHDIETGVLLARNPSAQEFARSIVFAAAIPDRAVHVTADRTQFLGRNGTVARPAALGDRSPLDGKTGGGLDPCFVQQVIVQLPPASTAAVCFLFGEGRDLHEVRTLLERYHTLDAVERARSDALAFWHESFERLQIKTPSRALDVLVNGWLPYQTLACRIWARTALYQSGGAFGYRDQIQDASALLPLWPDMTRAQILLHAAHQFEDGDVLHWWHPPRDRGIRTRFTDDLLWLPFQSAHYVQTSGDWRVLDERVPYLSARSLAPGEDEAYLEPRHSGTEGTLYEHCCRAIDRSLGRGAHGLPLFGTGDWNDGMNRVGREGRGESVWMGFFLYTVLGDFAALCNRRGDGERMRRYEQHRRELRSSLETGGWDGDWYRRGYYDNGKPLGSRESEECRIDALVQAWAVLSGAAPPDRAARVMRAVDQHLISETEGIIRLLWPPFFECADDPGYIKGYVRGVRENGGQYTHAALWVVRALAELGENHRVASLLEMLSPVHHARSRETVEVYRVEPYVVAADVYGAPPHVGRGGWTWYTGSAGWMYRIVLESLLGFRMVEGNALRISPCVPDDWPEFTLHYQIPGETTRYEIVARNLHGRGLGVREAELDGERLDVNAGVVRVPLLRDGRTHRVDLVLGKRTGETA